MNLFPQSVRRASLPPDEAILRRLEAMRDHAEPDPLFRRRLRGSVVNQFVALREGHAAPRPRTASMGRLGRAVLYASVALAFSVTGAVAASQHALPGDALYAMKRQIEALRLEVLPSTLHDELTAAMLGERVAELGRLAEAGEWELAEALAAPIEDEYRQLVELGASGAAVDRSLESRITVLAALVDRLPERARVVIGDILEDASASPPGGERPSGAKHHKDPKPVVGGANNDGTNPNGSVNQGGANNDGSVDPGAGNTGGGGSNGGGGGGSAPGKAGGAVPPPTSSDKADASPTPKPSPGARGKGGDKPPHQPPGQTP
jgi:hypothetical protein